MSAQWKPGDVALVEAGCQANRRIAIRTGARGNMGWAYSDTYDGRPTQNWSSDSSGIVTPVRRLAVIDPYDERNLDRLYDALVTEARKVDRNFAISYGALAMALCKYASPTPPKPDEPMGLGAVVEAINGNDFVRVSSSDEGWLRVDDKFGSPLYRYEEIAAVAVLHEGVTR